MIFHLFSWFFFARERRFDLLGPLWQHPGNTPGNTPATTRPGGHFGGDLDLEAGRRPFLAQRDSSFLVSGPKKGVILETSSSNNTSDPRRQLPAAPGGSSRSRIPLPKRGSNPTSPAHVPLPDPRSQLPDPRSRLPDPRSYTPALPGSGAGSGRVFGLPNGVHFSATPPRYGAILGLAAGAAGAAGARGTLSQSAVESLPFPRVSPG